MASAALDDATLTFRLWSRSGAGVALFLVLPCLLPAAVRATSGANPSSDILPAWSPDGRQIAFDSKRVGNTDIYAMNADGSDQRRSSPA